MRALLLIAVMLLLSACPVSESPLVITTQEEINAFYYGSFANGMRAFCNLDRQREAREMGLLITPDMMGRIVRRCTAEVDIFRQRLLIPDVESIPLPRVEPRKAGRM